MNLSNLEQIWNKLITALESTFSNKSIYINCIKPSKIVKFDNDSIYIQVPSIFAKSIFANEYNEIIKNFFKDHLNKTFSIVYLLPEEKIISKIDNSIISNVNNDLNKESNLNPEFTLDNFIVGEFNKSAYNAVCAISKNLGTTYNPLFIYGSTGLGKTHLMTALGNFYLKQFQNKKIKYIDSNEFTRDVFVALSKGGSFVEDLKQYYSSFDLLLIDDIQYLAGKEKTNEIFFNIFNNLVNNNKQIVITSDKNPELLDSLEERMVSRFSSGLTIKIDKPESDALKRIIMQKIKQQESAFIFQDEAIDEIIKYYNNDLRKLLGFLNKISFYAIQNLATNDIITKDFISGFINESKTRVLINNEEFNPELIIATICRWYGVKVELVKGKSRLKQLSNVRHICMYVLRHKYNMPLSDIGSYFSNRDHTTVMSAIEKVSKMIEKDNDLKEYIDKSLNKI